MTSYLQKYLPNISAKTEPLRKLEEKGTEWNWNNRHEEIFNDIKQMITTTPVLTYFDSE